MPSNKTNFRREPGTLNIIYDEVQANKGGGSRAIQAQINAIQNKITRLQEEVAQLQLDLAEAQAVEPPNIDAVQHAIQQLDGGVEVAVVTAELQVDPWNLELADATGAVTDAQEIIAERTP